MKTLSQNFHFMSCGLLWALLSMIGAGVISVHAADHRKNAIEVIAVGEASLEQLTPEEARQIAKRNARANGIEQAIGSEVTSRTLVKNFSLSGYFVRTLSKGFILEEKVERWDEQIYKEASDKPGVLTYKVTMRMKVVPMTQQRDPYFLVKTQLNKDIFIDRDEAILTVIPTKACYLSILNLASDDKITILFPNEYLKSNQLRENQTFIFPDRTVGSIVMATMPGHRRDAEAFIIIATRQPLNLLVLLGKSQDITLPELYNILLNIPVTEWVEEIIPYEVRRN